MATYYRMDRESRRERSDYRDLGFIVGSITTVTGDVILASQYDYQPYIFAPLIVANIASLGYEKIRNYLKKG